MALDLRRSIDKIRTLIRLRVWYLLGGDAVEANSIPLDDMSGYWFWYDSGPTIKWYD